MAVFTTPWFYHTHKNIWCECLGKTEPCGLFSREDCYRQCTRASAWLIVCTVPLFLRTLSGELCICGRLAAPRLGFYEPSRRAVACISHQHLQCRVYSPLSHARARRRGFEGRGDLKVVFTTAWFYHTHTSMVVRVPGKLNRWVIFSVLLGQQRGGRCETDLGSRGSHQAPPPTASSIC